MIKHIEGAFWELRSDLYLEESGVVRSRFFTWRTMKSFWGFISLLFVVAVLFKHGLSNGVIKFISLLLE
jgi:hypothetical protein